ncbi:MAG: hypothetical protein HeimC3_31520 [Candidatus Heimdallarchaeota archaeon LC_3]|nr:MAG: hypothetical protein HeimC3_31520 [Candidatus Heimdallarchaeota archaeon LC_3]
MIDLKTKYFSLVAITLSFLMLSFVAVIGPAPVLGEEGHDDTKAEFWILGIEFKGTADANEPYIAEGDKVERYVFIPDTIIVQKGQEVTLHFLGVNGGGGHPTTIEHYVESSFTFKRNQTVTKVFTADKAGIFAIVCSSHQPTMNAWLIVEDGTTETTPSGDSVNIWMLGIEFKGTAGANEPYIAEGDKVERYVFYPNIVRVNKGQEVTINFLGINGGGGHPTTIENYAESSFTFKRNQTVTKTFTADKAGVFDIVCTSHQPTMNAWLIVEEDGSKFTPLPNEVVSDFWMLGIEFKGTAGANEPYIAEGDKVERYVFYPNNLFVNKDAEVTINFLGINGGGGHPTIIEHHVESSFTFKRNQTVSKTFTADEAGVFEITCSAHQPTMNAYLFVIEKPSSSADIPLFSILFGFLVIGAIARLRINRK